ncbi:Cd(II)/Pb(II)-responsive transcriptional regulator [Marinobacter vulgaris]|uniref:Cd(II)/Pb(II)-responsive transcriptional regulator n=1 Tax=Marinobacter vulgaris TaxID=1928331 RepID=A0A2V3ZQB9_9GAMM|nr:Cd(II)/Pb(II)-responsive transcriptional regulator [Marinobacter vulgaris]PXX93688.1 Cd(II)/Pb(II)-responsive transcriptional regulator [Marinobacter vulgaris]TSJ72296.1 Cd(II)/Pb(II)-responsive transcriptional regulator [Marinobacter vulgaris]
MKIGEISKATGIPVETIRYYEKIGLVPEPAREASGYRNYRQSHLQRLLFIRRCRNLDMAQDEIRELIRLADQPDADCSEVDALLARHLSHVRERLRELASLESTLEQLQQACSEGRTVSECGILGGLTSEPSANTPAGNSSHIPGTHGTR